MKKNMEQLVLELFEIADEFCAREINNNAVYKKFHSVSWEELCDKGMEILEEMKVG